MSIRAIKPRSVFYSLRSRLLLLTVGVSLTAMLLLTWAAMMLVSRHLEGSIQEHLDNDVAIASLIFNNTSSRMQAAIESISLDNTVKTTLRLGIQEQLHSHLAQLATQHRLDFLFILNGMGEIQVSAMACFTPGTNLYDHPVFSEALLGKGYGGTVLEQDPIILYQLELSGKNVSDVPVLVMEAAKPISFRDQVIGMVLGGRMISRDSSLLQEIKQATTCDPVMIMAGNRVAAVDSTSETAIQPGDTLRLGLDYGRPGKEYRELDAGTPFQHRFVYQYSPLSMPLENSLSAIVCFQDRQNFSALLSRLQRLILTIAGATLALAMLLTLWLSRSISTPLQQLSIAMRRLREQESISLLPVERFDEIGDLFRGYNRMAAAIEQRIMDLALEISVRRKTEQELANESERLQVTIHSLADAVLSTDNKGRVVLVNQAACKLFDQTQEQLLGRFATKLFHCSAPPSGKPLLHPVTALLDHKKSELSSGDVQLSLPDGRRLLVTISCALLQNDSGWINGTVLVLRDVTERRKMEEELAKTLKLESVGVLAGGIAHDFNNLLTAILGNVSLAKMVAGDNTALGNNLEEAEKACLRAADLTKQLLTFAKGGAPVRKAVSLEKIIEDTVAFVCRGSKVLPRFVFDETLWLADIDAGQISQVLDNLAINAIQAMPEGGEVTVSTSNSEILPGSILPLRPGRYVQIAVEDRGIGISQEKLGRIFDPYFTDKEKGSGLGLAISYSIITKHGGYITVDSIVGRGTIFHIYLPAAESAEEEQESRQESRNAARQGTGRLLLMDDELLIRKVVGAMLERLGYEVVFASEGMEALTLYRKFLGSTRAFDAVILDLTVPGGVGGEETIKKLLAIDPEVRAIVSSGYADHPVMADYHEYGFRAVVAKPFRIDELNRVLTDVLADGW